MLLFSFDVLFKPEKDESGGNGGRAVRLERIDGRDGQGVLLHQSLVWRTSTDCDRLVIKVQEYRRREVSWERSMNRIVFRKPHVRQVWTF